MLAHNKRVIYVDGQAYPLADMYLQEWIDPRSFGAMEVFRKAYDKAVQLSKDSPKWMEWFNKYGFHNFLASFCWSVVNVEVQYRYDTDMFKRADWWSLPSETYNWKKGDCEDTTFLLASALEHVQNVTDIDDRYFAVLGFYVHEGQYYGHGYVMWLHDYIGKWMILETTWDCEVSPFIWYNWTPDKYVPAIMFNRSDFFRMDIESHRSVFDLNNDWYERHKDAIKAMINYIETGKQLLVSFMHKLIRPVPIPAFTELSTMVYE
ncbi:MAG: hypothetical protein ACTSYJ_09245 [Candidatus Thorarchaeota archaeon]